MASLFYYYSSMNAGKSTTLLQASHNYRERGMNTLLLTPELDDRSGSRKLYHESESKPKPHHSLATTISTA